MTDEKTTVMPPVRVSGSTGVRGARRRERRLLRTLTRLMAVICVTYVGGGVVFAVTLVQPGPWRVGVIIATVVAGVIAFLPITAYRMRE